MHHHCNPFHCFVPPHVLEEMARSEDPAVREAAVKNIAVSASLRSRRITLSGMPRFAAIPSPAGGKYRLVYDGQRRTERVTEKLLRKEGDSESGDKPADEAYDNAGSAYDLYYEEFDRDSLDGNGMSLVSVVHYGDNIDNAFWTGDKMCYGDGDMLFGPMTQDIDVAAHEFTHGVIQYESNLEYFGESGALNEHFADVFGLMAEQRLKGQTVDQADWWLGGGVLSPALKQRGVRGIRTMTEDKAYENDPVLGTDRQPKHLKDKYTGLSDRGGVHINSGIPNHAFYLAATKLGGYAWKTDGDGAVGRIWYKTLKALNTRSNFREAAAMCHQIAGAEYGTNSREQQAVEEAWSAVGIEVGVKVA